MVKEPNWAVLGISATLVVGGVALLLTSSEPAALVVGVVTVALGALLPPIFWLKAAFLSERAELAEAIDRASTRLDS